MTDTQDQEKVDEQGSDQQATDVIAPSDDVVRAAFTAYDTAGKHSDALVGVAQLVYQAGYVDGVRFGAAVGAAQAAKAAPALHAAGVRIARDQVRRVLHAVGMDAAQVAGVVGVLTRVADEIERPVDTSQEERQ